MKLNKETKQLESIETYDIEDMVKLCNMISEDAEKEDKEFIKMSICDFKEIMKAWYYLLEECNKNAELIDKKEPHKGYKPTCFGTYDDDMECTVCLCEEECKKEIKAMEKEEQEEMELHNKIANGISNNCFGCHIDGNEVCNLCVYEQKCMIETEERKKCFGKSYGKRPIIVCGNCKYREQCEELTKHEQKNN